VIAGKSVVAFRRDSDETPAPKSFGFVQVYDTKPWRRLSELLKSQEVVRAVSAVRQFARLDGRWRGD
jgi:hypothetical protein